MLIKVYWPDGTESVEKVVTQKQIKNVNGYYVPEIKRVIVKDSKVIYIDEIKYLCL